MISEKISNSQCYDFLLRKKLRPWSSLGSPPGRSSKPNCPEQVGILQHQAATSPSCSCFIFLNALQVSLSMILQFASIVSYKNSFENIGESINDTLDIQRTSGWKAMVFWNNFYLGQTLQIAQKNGMQYPKVWLWGNNPFFFNVKQKEIYIQHSVMFWGVGGRLPIQVLLLWCSIKD